MSPRLACSIPIFVLLALGPGATGSTDVREPEPRFDDGAADVLRHRCVKCHGPRDRGGELRLDSFGAVMRGGEDGPVVIAGDLDGSMLYQKIIRRHRPPMPPRVPLPADERETLRKWIAAGARP